MIKIVFTFFLIFLGFSSFVYSKSEYRDPFESSLPQVKEKEGVMSHQGKTSDYVSDILPDLDVQGIILKGNFPQTIIDGEVYKTGDSLKDVNAKIFRIEKGVVFISYREKIYRIKIQKKEEIWKRFF